MQTINKFTIIILSFMMLNHVTAQRELLIEEMGADGDAVIELITNDLPTDPTHRNLLIGIDQSSEGFLKMLSDHNLGFWTDNLQRMVIDKDGRIGLGESDPQVRLHVSSDGIAQQQTIVQTLESVISDRPILLFSEGGSTLASGMSIEYDGRLSGTNNKMYINDITGTAQYTFESGGDMGVGTLDPLEKLDVNGEIALSDGTGEINFYEGSTEKASIKYNGATISLATVDVTGDVSLQPADDILLDGGDDILFRSGGITRMFMNNDGDLGMGITNPTAKLDVRHTSTSSDPILYLRQLDGDFARMRMTSNSTTEFWNIDARSLGTDPEFNIVYDDNGSLNTIMSLDGDGSRMGINTDAPNANLTIQQVGSTEEALRFINNTNTDNWAFEIGVSDLFMYFNGVQVGQFNDVDGVYSATSDRRLKSDIEKIEDGVLNKVLKLKPSRYYYNHDETREEKSVGFIAQELQEQFPELVVQSDQEDSDILAVKYPLISVYNVKAIQEQQDIIDSISQELNEMKKLVEELSSRLDK